MSPYLLFVLTRYIQPKNDRVWLDAHKASAAMPYARPFYGVFYRQ